MSEEEFRSVRTLPRSPHSTTAHAKQELHGGKKRSHKGKGRFKISGKRRPLELCDMMNEEDEEDVKERTSFNFNESTYHQPAIAVTIPASKDHEDTKDIIGLEKTSCVTNFESEVTLPVAECEPPQKSFQDIVEEAMRQSNISFTDDSENDKASVMVLDVPVTNTENVCNPKDRTFESQQESIQQLSVSAVNIKSSWNTVNVHLKRTNNGKSCTARSIVDNESFHRNTNKDIAHLQPKTCKRSLILPNVTGFNPLMINTGIHQAQALPTVLSGNVQASPLSSSTSSSSSAFLSPQYEVDKKNAVSRQLEAEVLNMVDSNRLNIISANSQQATIMLVADDSNSFTTVPHQNYILKDLEKSSE